MLRIGWEREQATLVARNRVSKTAANGGDGRSYILQVWDFLVELPDADGTPTRLVIRVKNPDLELPDLGGPVPVMVNRRRTKAAFDTDDPTISPRARRRLGEARQRAKAAEKAAAFEAKRTGRS